MNISSDEFNFGLIESRAGVVFESDPTDEIDEILVLWGDDVVGSFPTEACGDVGEFGVDFSGSGGVNFPSEGRVELGIGAEGGEAGFAWEGELEFAIDLDDGLGVFAAWDIATSDHLALNRAVGLLGFAEDEIDGLVFEEREEKFLGERIIAIILLEDLDGEFCGGIAKDHGVGFEVSGDSGEGEVVGAGLKCEGNGLANDREVSVVDGE